MEYIMMLVYLAVVVLILAGMWKTFEKAGRPGWNGIVPIYNFMVMAELVGKPAWWGLLTLIPCVNIIVIIILSMEFAKRFGKDALYGLGLAFLGFIFWPMLGFSDARWQGPTAQGFAPIMPPPPAQ